MVDTRRLADEFRKTIRYPRRALRLLEAEARKLWWQQRRSTGPDWVGNRRAYRSYEEYVDHQRSKLAVVDLKGYDQEFRAILISRLNEIGIDVSGKSVLCLAARIGTEVKAFHDRGAFAVGIDLEPGPDNRLVLPGDFHQLQWPDACVDTIYTNSLDHALDLDKVVSEIKRVLKSDGQAVVEVARGGAEGGTGFGEWEASSWERAADVADRFVLGGFRIAGETEFVYPWPGTAYYFELGS